MHKEVFTLGQLALLPLIKKFYGDFYLVGGTALALQYGHRRSIDFDLFTKKSFENQKILRLIRRNHHIDRIYVDETDQLTLIADNIKMTFFRYEYPIKHIEKLDDIITLPDPLSIAAMKAFALGRRSKWKDYVDLYFILQHHSLKEIVEKAHKYYSAGEFDEKLFRIQLAYHSDISYIEPVEYMPGFAVDDNIIKKKLTEISLS
ncbi:MAG: nucleotidyl transferase AbiEii/AbiGii toxin family protein [Patescibacteria group bacterium]